MEKFHIKDFSINTESVHLSHSTKEIIKNEMPGNRYDMYKFITRTWGTKKEERYAREKERKEEGGRGREKQERKRVKEVKERKRS